MRHPFLLRAGAAATLVAFAALVPATAGFAAPEERVPVPVPDPQGNLLVSAVSTIGADPLELDLSTSPSWATGDDSLLGGLDSCRLSRSIDEPEESFPASGEANEEQAAGTEPAPSDATEPAPSDESGVASSDETPSESLEDDSAAPETNSDSVTPAGLEPALAVDYMGSNLRVYSTLSVEIVKAGVYTFRVVDSTEVAGSKSMDDPYLALYRSFDPAALDEGLVGCNDDMPLETLPPDFDYGSMDAYFAGYDAPEESDVELHPAFTVSLEPGTYTLLTTTYGAQSKLDWVDSRLGPQSVVFEYWGPECGIAGSCADSEPVSTAPEAPELAETGADTTGAAVLAGAALLAGAAFLLQARRVRATRG